MDSILQWAQLAPSRTRRLVGRVLQHRNGVQHPAAPFRRDRPRGRRAHGTPCSPTPGHAGPRASWSAACACGRTASRRAASYPFHRGLHACRSGRYRGPQDRVVRPPDELRQRPVRSEVGGRRRPRDRRPRLSASATVPIGFAVDGSSTSRGPSSTARSTRQRDEETIRPHL